MGEMTVTLDCDVLNADGGTRCAAITGAWVALALAFRHLRKMNVLKADPMAGQVAAVSCGIFGGEAVLDLDYEENSAAGADANFVLTDAGGIVEIQGTAERAPFSEAAASQLLGWRAAALACCSRCSATRSAPDDGADAATRRAAGAGQPQSRQAR